MLEKKDWALPDDSKRYKYQLLSFEQVKLNCIAFLSFMAKWWLWFDKINFNFLSDHVGLIFSALSESLPIM
ncbi:hypothetical protein Fmac_009473 [Flemingia macrophylla]|uniref:Uncharacterized protein n=1 Tax=Flemingia macrophylla TaxID=520843 RepID=A0ABD1N0B8_9FABA